MPWPCGGQLPSGRRCKVAGGQLPEWSWSTGIDTATGACGSHASPLEGDSAAAQVGPPSGDELRPHCCQVTPSRGAGRRRGKNGHPKTPRRTQHRMHRQTNIPRDRFCAGTGRQSAPVAPGRHHEDADRTRAAPNNCLRQRCKTARRVASQLTARSLQGFVPARTASCSSPQRPDRSPFPHVTCRAGSGIRTSAAWGSGRSRSAYRRLAPAPDRETAAMISRTEPGRPGFCTPIQPRTSAGAGSTPHRAPSPPASRRETAEAGPQCCETVPERKRGEADTQGDAKQSLCGAVGDR